MNSDATERGRDLAVSNTVLPQTRRAEQHGTDRPTVGAGDRYGQLVVVGRDTGRSGYLICSCDCGREKSVRRANLIRGDHKTCGQCRLDLVGRTFGRLVVVERVANLYPTVKHPAGKTAFACRCECGIVKVVQVDHLRTGRVVSCGCRKREYDLGPRNTKHGMNTKALRDVYGGRPSRLFLRHGILWDQFLALLTAQGHCCAICGRKITYKTATIDHDHSCCPGKRSCGRCARGALCVPCNAGLGMFGDDPARLQAARHYLTAVNPVPAVDACRPGTASGQREEPEQLMPPTHAI